MHHKKQKSNPMSSEESNKTSQKTPSQDYPYDLMWDIEELKRSIVESAEESYNFEDMAGG